MIDVLLYFTLNFLGFFVFLAIWNRLPKPKPFDYTTIPGLKLNVSSAEEIPSLGKIPHLSPLDLFFDGHIKELQKHPDFSKFLDHLHLVYGPLSSFWWSDRYVVVVSSENLVSELKKSCNFLVAISPFSIGSYLHGQKKYCTTLNFAQLSKNRKKKLNAVTEICDQTLTISAQDHLIYHLDHQTEENGDGDNIRIIENNLRQSKWQLQSRDRASLCRPLLVVFSEQIWIGAYPVPKFVPIVIHTSEILRNCLDDELFATWYARFYWLPGVLHSH